MIASLSLTGGNNMNLDNDGSEHYVTYELTLMKVVQDWIEMREFFRTRNSVIICKKLYRRSFKNDNNAVQTRNC